MEKDVQVIPQTRRMHSNKPINAKAKRRVAAYARVSTDSEEQLTSYEAQVKYYTDYIKNNPEWQFVSVFADEGISATSTKHRSGFNEMVKRALNGEIDLIITKSVSRFARNTVDSLTTVRNLKEHNVEVYFEKENIYTFDGKGELLITIMSSLAQEESRSISENVTWGQRKRFADGKIIMPFSSFLGYERGEDGQPVIVEKEAEVVRLIYKLFIDGKTPTYIAKYLTAQNIPTPRKCRKWSQTTVESILKNEKYKGSALLQKKFTVDFLNKKVKVNEGEIPQYYVEKSHPAIVSKDVYDLAQMEFEKRGRIRGYKPTASCFSGKIYCGDCGGMYGSKVWHSNSQYRRTIWQCNDKFKNEIKCTTPHLADGIIKHDFIDVFNYIIRGRDKITEFIEETVMKLLDTKDIDKRIAEAKADADAKLKAASDYMELNSRIAIKQDEYNEKFDELMGIYGEVKERLTKLEQERTEMINRGNRCKEFLKTIRSSELLTVFDEELFSGIVERITVYADKYEFKFKDGSTVVWGISKGEIIKV